MTQLAFHQVSMRLGYACKLAGPSVLNRERRAAAWLPASGEGEEEDAPAASQACVRMPSIVMRCAARPISIWRTCGHAPMFLTDTPSTL